jgi:hypothetical protein
MQPTVEITKEILDRLDEEFVGLSFVPVQEAEMAGPTVLNLRPQHTTATMQVRLDSDAQNWLARFAGVPLSYVSKIDDARLATDNWNYWLRRRNQNGDISVLKAVVRGDEVKAFTTNSFHPHPPSAIVNACRGAVADAVFERAPLASRKDFDFILTGPDLYQEFQNQVGMKSDVHHFGIGVKYNFMGDQSPEVRVYGHRHWCGNIMESAYGIGGKQFRIFTSQPQVILQKFQEFTTKGVEFIRNTMIPHIRATMETPMAEPQRDIQDFLDQNHVPERVQEIVYESYRAEDLGGTHYHLVNALTRAANSDRTPVGWIQQLHRLAGQATVSHDPSHANRRCTACHQVIVIPGNN